MASTTPIKTVIIQGTEPAGCINYNCPVKFYCTRYGNNSHELWPFDGHITADKCTGFILKNGAQQKTAPKAHRHNFIEGKQL